MPKSKKSESKEIFVIVENSWEYNDEYYYRSGDGGTPKLYFLTKKEADERCQQLNDFARSSADPADYSDGYSDMDMSSYDFYDVYSITLGE